MMPADVRAVLQFRPWLAVALSASALTGCKFKSKSLLKVAGGAPTVDTSSYCSDASSAPNCLQAVVVDDSAMIKTLVYRSKAIDEAAPNSDIKSAVILVHGKNGAADEVFEAASLALTDAVATAIVVPYFGSAKAPPSLDGVKAVSWANVEDWSSGLVGDNSISSFQVLTGLALKLTAAYPKLTQLTFAGFSAGGQMVQRFAAVSAGLPPGTPVKVRFVVASPSSYLYFDNSRILGSASCTDHLHCALAAKDFAPLAASSDCAASYNVYKFGLDGVPSPLADWLKGKDGYVSNNVSYLVNTGDADDKPQDRSGKAVPPDAKCASVVQGPANASFRLQRGLTFISHLKQVVGGNWSAFPNHQLFVLDGKSLGDNGCGHDEYCVYGSDLGKNLLTGEGSATPWSPVAP